MLRQPHSATVVSSIDLRFVKSFTIERALVMPEGPYCRLMPRTQFSSP